jgi:hypothetical protein
MNQNPDKIWYGLCRRKNHALCSKVLAQVQAFLCRYVSNSMTRFPVFGPEEYVERQAITCASTMENVWRCLVAEVDLTVLDRKRKEDPNGPTEWRLKLAAKKESSFTKGPVAEISNVR